MSNEIKPIPEVIPQPDIDKDKPKEQPIPGEFEKELEKELERESPQITNEEAKQIREAGVCGETLLWLTLILNTWKIFLN